MEFFSLQMKGSTKIHPELATNNIICSLILPQKKSITLFQQMKERMIVLQPKPKHESKLA